VGKISGVAEDADIVCDPNIPLDSGKCGLAQRPFCCNSPTVLPASVLDAQWTNDPGPPSNEPGQMSTNGMGVPVMSMAFSEAVFKSKDQCLEWWRSAIPQKFLASQDDDPYYQAIGSCWVCDLDAPISFNACGADQTLNPAYDNRMGTYPWGNALLRFCGCMPNNVNNDPGGVDHTAPSWAIGSSGYCSIGLGEQFMSVPCAILQSPY
jgi:hypothetical protein